MFLRKNRLDNTLGQPGVFFYLLEEVISLDYRVKIGGIYEEKI